MEHIELSSVAVAVAVATLRFDSMSWLCMTRSVQFIRLDGRQNAHNNQREFNMKFIIRISQSAEHWAGLRQTVASWNRIWQFYTLHKTLEFTIIVCTSIILNYGSSRIHTHTHTGVVWIQWRRCWCCRRNEPKTRSLNGASGYGDGRWNEIGMNKSTTKYVASSRVSFLKWYAIVRRWHCQFRVFARCFAHSLWIELWIFNSSICPCPTFSAKKDDNVELVCIMHQLQQRRRTTAKGRVVVYPFTTGNNLWIGWITWNRVRSTTRSPL